MRRILLRVLLISGVLFLALQLVPYGHDHSNPSTRNEPVWDSPRTRELAVAACYDCHSNQTKWPLYSYVAPMSWLVTKDVKDGRDALNFQEIDGEDDGDDIAEEVEEGTMPPSQYKLLHPEARLTAAERAELIAGLESTFGEEDGGDNSGPGGGDDD